MSITFKNREINPTLQAQYGDDVSEFLKPIYAARSIGFGQLDLSLKKLLPPNFANLDNALVLLEQAIIGQKRILIVGDFDADGATASAIMIKSLRLFGAKFVDFLVPNRFTHGYGLSEKIVEVAIKEKYPDVIITVDNGIASIEGVALAKKNGIAVIITDHHLPVNTLPAADAIINPNLADCPFASKNLAGVGVAFYLCAALKTHLKSMDYFAKNTITEPDLRTLLDIVALGTVADVVKLDQNNRILVKAGLDIIKQRKNCVGIQALMSVAKRNNEQVQASDFGFALAPRINAAGRLADISIGIRCLLSDDFSTALKYAQELDNFNQERKQVQEKMQNEADAILDKVKTISSFSISLYHPDWHEGVVGIVAGKLCRDCFCPTAIFAKNGDMLKGSLRSISKIHLKDLLTEIDNKHPDLMQKFGGHAMAAGMSLLPENFEKFSQLFDKAVKDKLENTPPTGDILVDGELLETQITLENAQKLLDNSPWGQGFEEPVFQGKFIISAQKVVGEKHLKCELKLKNGALWFPAIAFFQAPITQEVVNIAYKLNINHFRGVSNLQLMIEEISE